MGRPCRCSSVLGAASLALLAARVVVASPASAFLASTTSDSARQPVVLVTGATGRLGAVLYGMLKERGVTVRAFVRNATKARSVLGCSKCDASEGIYVGDLTQKDAVDAAVQGASALAIATSAIPICEGSTCHYPEGAYPIDVDFHGGKAQIEAFARATAGSGGKPGTVVMCSAAGTTQPDTFLEQMGNGHIGFFKLNEEAFLMSSGLPYTIVKPCGLTNEDGGSSELLAGHDDELDVQPPVISRSDVARVMVEALLQPEAASNLRFDLCSRSGTPTKDIVREVFQVARYPWAKQGPQQAAAEEIAV